MILKNPIVLGILTAVISYLYLHWKEEKKYRRQPFIQKKSVNILIPGIIGAVVWLITSIYFDNYSKTSNIEEKMKTTGPPIFKLVKSEDSIGSRSFHLVGKNKVRIPPTDVFIDVAKF